MIRLPVYQSILFIDTKQVASSLHYPYYSKWRGCQLQRLSHLFLANRLPIPRFPSTHSRWTGEPVKRSTGSWMTGCQFLTWSYSLLVSRLPVPHSLWIQGKVVHHGDQTAHTKDLFETSRVEFYFPRLLPQRCVRPRLWCVRVSEFFFSSRLLWEKHFCIGVKANQAMNRWNQHLFRGRLRGLLLSAPSIREEGLWGGRWRSRAWAERVFRSR